MLFGYAQMTSHTLGFLTKLTPPRSSRYNPFSTRSYEPKGEYNDALTCLYRKNILEAPHLRSNVPSQVDQPVAAHLRMA